MSVSNRGAETVPTLGRRERTAPEDSTGAVSEEISNSRSKQRKLAAPSCASAGPATSAAAGRSSHRLESSPEAPLDSSGRAGFSTPATRTLDAEVPELQFDVPGLLREIATDIIRSYVQSGNTVTFVLRFDHHKVPVLQNRFESGSTTRDPGTIELNDAPAVLEWEQFS